MVIIADYFDYTENASHGTLKGKLLAINKMKIFNKNLFKIEFLSQSLKKLSKFLILFLSHNKN